MVRFFLGLWIVVIALVGGNIFTANVLASTSSENWEYGSAGPVFGWDAPLYDKDEKIIQPIFVRSFSRGSYDQQKKFSKIAKDDKSQLNQEILFFQYGLGDSWEFDGQFSYQESRIKDAASEQEGRSKGWADSYLYLRNTLVKEKGWMPCVTSIYQAKFPTGKYKGADSDKLGTDLSGTGTYDPGIGLVVTKSFNPFVVHADFIYSIPTNSVMVDEVKTKYSRYVNYDFALDCIFAKQFNFMIEFNGYAQSNNKADGVKVLDSGSRYLAVAPYIGWFSEKVQVLLGYQRTISGKNTDALNSYVATYVYKF
jgi:hypothetical protein